MIEACALPLEFNGTQTAEIQTRKEGDRQHPEWRRLVHAIGGFAKPAPPAAPATKLDEEVGNIPYWRAFAPIAESHGRSRNGLKLPKSENFNTPVGRPEGFEVYASAFVTRSKDRGYGPYLWIWAKVPKSADYLVPIIISMQSVLDAAAGEAVRISRVSKHGIWIWLKKQGDPDDRSEWPKQHAWMAERMAKFSTIYREQILPKISANS